MVCPKYLIVYYLLILQTHYQELMNQWVVMATCHCHFLWWRRPCVWHIVSKWLSLLRLCLHSLLSSYLQIVSVEISLRFHTLHQRGMDLQMRMNTATAQCMLAVFAHNWLCYYWQGTNDSPLLSHMLQSRHLHERKEQELGTLLAWKEEQKLSMRLHHQSTSQQKFTCESQPILHTSVQNVESILQQLHGIA
jgi:hypothetical protein